MQFKEGLEVIAEHRDVPGEVAEIGGVAFGIRHSLRSYLRPTRSPRGDMRVGRSPGANTLIVSFTRGWCAELTPGVSPAQKVSDRNFPKIKVQADLTFTVSWAGMSKSSQVGLSLELAAEVGR